MDGWISAFCDWLQRTCSVSFLPFACQKDVKWFLYHSLKLVASPMYDSVVVPVIVAW